MMVTNAHYVLPSYCFATGVPLVIVVGHAQYIGQKKESTMSKMGWSGMEDSTPTSSTTTNPLDQPDDSMPDSSDIGGKGGWKGMEDGTPCASAGNGSESGMTGGTRVCDK